MLQEAGERWPMVRQTFAEASDMLGYDLWQVCQHGPESDLNRTEITQPVVLTAGVALWRQWLLQEGRKPDFLAGHSLGEYTALVAAESLRFGDAVKLVRLRGELMQQAVPEGVGLMAAILGLEDDAVREACAEAAGQEIVEAVNFNAPLQVVIAGHRTAVERAMAICKAKGAKRALALPVSVPSHCTLMGDAAEELARELDAVDFNDAVIPVVQNVPARSEVGRDAIRLHLVQQLYSPVRWTESMSWLVAQGVTDIVECGPGKVLNGLIKRVAKDANLYSLETLEGYEAAQDALR